MRMSNGYFHKTSKNHRDGIYTPENISAKPPNRQYRQWSIYTTTDCKHIKLDTCRYWRFGGLAVQRNPITLKSSGNQL